MIFFCGILVLLAVFLACPDRPVGKARFAAVARRHPPSLLPSSPGRHHAFRRSLLRALHRLRHGDPRGNGACSGSEVAILADQVAALYTAGLAPDRIWPAVAEHGPSPPTRAVARAVAAGQRRGLPPVAVLGPQLDGSPSLAQLALALEISERTGAGTAHVLHRLAGALRAEQRTVEEIRGVLAGPRATASILTILPVGGLALGTLLGGRPWQVLLFTAPGRGALFAGCLFWGAGRLWARFLIRKASEWS
jgi:tight adherence protein B